METLTQPPAPGDRRLALELDDIIQHRRLAPLFQPIAALRGAMLYGYEALIRGPSDSPLHSPLNLFSTAASYGRLAELELACREVSIEQFGQLQLQGRLFVNVSPAVVLQPDYPHQRTLQFLHKAGISNQRVVIELTEHYPVEDYEMMRQAVTHYREMGFAVAIDDLGAGYSGLRGWSELRPDFVKIDRHFVQNVHADPAKRQFIHSICEIAHALGSEVIAEGVETPEELETILGFDVAYAQGYHFARPSSMPPTSLPRTLFGHDNGLRDRPRLGELVAGLAQDRPYLQPHQSLNSTIDIFLRVPELRSMAVVHRGEPLGLVTRLDMMNIYSSRFGRDLHGRKPIIAFMRHNPLVVEESTPLERLSKRITGTDSLSTDEDFIIVDGAGHYLGMGTLMDLLRRITELQIRYARYANPLTQLPGNVPIQEQIDRLLGKGEPFVVVYADLDQFKPFNDHYGYARGDDVIRTTAQLLLEACDPALNFVGHVGGDDFILVLRGGDWRARCDRALELFGQRSPLFHDPADREAGGYQAMDRRGEVRWIPLISLSMGAVLVEPGRFGSHHEVATIASEVKHRSKEIPGNSLFVDRRLGPVLDTCPSVPRQETLPHAP